MSRSRSIAECRSSVNGKKYRNAGDDLVDALNRLGGKHAVGQVTLVENRLVGMKSRGVYETPGGTILYEAHKALEQICLERDLYHYKQQLALRYAELVYYGQWFHPLREAMQAFVDTANQVVTGTVRVKLYKGRATAVSAVSPTSLYDTKLASFAMKGYDVTAARGFIDLFGLPMKVRGLKQKARGRAKSTPVAGFSTPSLLLRRRHARVSVLDACHGAVRMQCGGSVGAALGCRGCCGSRAYAAGGRRHGPVLGVIPLIIPTRSCRTTPVGPLFRGRPGTSFGPSRWLMSAPHAILPGSAHRTGARHEEIVHGPAH